MYTYLRVHHWDKMAEDGARLRQLTKMLLAFGEHEKVAPNLPMARFLSGSQGIVAVKERIARLLSALVSTNWNKSKAADKLRWSRMTLYRKMAKHHVTGSKKLESS
jgi:transcriptional regulator of acetoin/glycerol metabolism